MLLSALGAVAGGSLAPRLGADAVNKLLVRSARPEDFEMTLEGFSTWLTPVESFYIRTHAYTPTIDMAKWSLRIDGLVETPLTLKLEDLRKFTRAELVGVLQCAGNGRSYYVPGVPGMQWEHGGVGNARWSGIRLMDVLKKAGVKPAGTNLMMDGADEPPGTMPDFVRSLPIKKALHPDTLLAFEMNGQPLTPSHGFPLRIVVPGWAGDSWVKWLTHMEVLDHEYDGFFMKTAYRHPIHSVPPGSTVDPSQMTPVTEINPESVIASPLHGSQITLDRVTIRGAAWSGESPVVRVDVSTDSGRSWKAASLGGQATQYGWRLWEFPWTPKERGSVVIMARATDRAGQTQPLVEDWNPSGYLWNVVQQVRVEVGDTAAPPPMNPVTNVPDFPASAKAACLPCHGTDMIAGQHLSRPQWEREVDKMVRWGASVKPDGRPALIDFLVSHFGPR